MATARHCQEQTPPEADSPEADTPRADTPKKTPPSEISTAADGMHPTGMHSCEFKIRLIRLGLSFQKQKFLYLNSQPTDSQSWVITITL